MALTASVRRWYPEPVVGVLTNGDPVCDHDLRPAGPAVLVDFPSRLTSASHIPLKVHWKQREAWQAYTTVMEHLGVQIADDASGTASCRKIANRKGISLHSYLSAFDLIPLTEHTPAFIRAVKAIRCKGAADQVFLHGTTFSDPMHWQMNVPPLALAAGIDWTTVLGSEQEDDLAHLSEEAQKWLQARYEAGQALVNPHTNQPDPERPTSTPNVLREYRERRRIVDIPNATPEQVAQETMDQ